MPLPTDHSYIKCLIESIVKALQDEDGRTKTRELALAVTHLQTARMWIEEHQRNSSQECVWCGDPATRCEDWGDKVWVCEACSMGDVQDACK